LKTRVRTFYPADPVGVVPGGVDTFIRGLVKWAPEDIEFSLVGMTTDPEARPVRRWTRCSLGRREFDFFPVVRVADAGSRSRLPLSLRYTAGVVRSMSDLRRDFDVFEYHRVEPGLLFTSDRRAKNAFFHQDMAVIRTARAADILWKHLPGIYEGIERRVVGSLSSAWCVREEGAESLRRRYPLLQERIRFIPTWVDTEVFSPSDPARRESFRQRLVVDWGLAPAARIVVTVGRLDSQKDPGLLLSAVGRLVAEGREVALLYVGDGVLRADLEKRVEAEGLARCVRFVGLRPPAAIADILRGVDVFALSSAYEGMPMALLEALGSGVPVATTDVGEVRRVVFNGRTGAIAADRSEQGFTHCLRTVLDQLPQLTVAECLTAIEPYRPAGVLGPVYDNYRQLGRIAHGR